MYNLLCSASCSNAGFVFRVLPLLFCSAPLSGTGGAAQSLLVPSARLKGISRVHPAEDQHKVLVWVSVVTGSFTTLPTWSPLVPHVQEGQVSLQVL